MRYFILLITFGSVIIHNSSRPIRTAENESEIEDAEYEGGDNSAADDYLREDQVKEYEKGNEKKSIFSSKPVDVGDNNPSEYKIDVDKNSEGEDAVEEDDISPNRRYSNQNIGNSENEEREEIKRPVINSRSYKTDNDRSESENIRDNGRSDSSSNEEGEIFECDQRRSQEDYINNNDLKAFNGHPILKHYYDKVQVDLVQKRPLRITNSNRDRRQIPGQNNEFSATDLQITDKKNDLESGNDDSEAAIKRNIKKLSREDLENLLSSLSDDKKVLLKKIIDNKPESVSKREITKKAGAVEENNCLESGSAVDSNSGSASPIILTESTTTEVNEVSTTKSSENDSSSKKSETKDELKDIPELIKQESGVERSEQTIESKEENLEDEQLLKNENKREISSEKDKNLNDLFDITNTDTLNDSRYLSPDNEAEYEKDDYWSELLKDESELHKAYKRETDNLDDSSQVKSLEESFSNSNMIRSKEMPLIRVKRTNKIVNRNSEHGNNMKVPYFPEAANDETDENEKSEFDDSGIYDQSFNYDKVTKESYLAGHVENENDSHERCNNNLKSSKYSKIKANIDTTNLGSDTDNILSNVEGVDDSSMFNGRHRNKRTKDINDALESLNSNRLSLNRHDAIKSENKNNDLSNAMDIVKYQENDAFGPVSRNSNEDLARYKRIRRLKLSSE